MFFLALVGAPVLRQLDDPELRARLFGELGRRFRSAGWWTIGVLVATGVANLHLRGVLDPAVLDDPAFWGRAETRAGSAAATTADRRIGTAAARELPPRRSSSRPAAGRAGTGSSRRRSDAG